ncbi:MAG: nitrile hydratase [Kiloniellales bacterium]
MTRAHHDLGGRPAGAIDRTEHDYAQWEKEVDALYELLDDEKRRLVRVDELRRGIESLAPEEYDRLGYYERWIASITAILVEKGVLDRAEIDARVRALRASFAPPSGGEEKPG